MIACLRGKKEFGFLFFILLLGDDSPSKTIQLFAHWVWVCES